MNFDSFNIHERILANVQTLGFKTPTPIQQKTIPSILEGRDVMGLAQTGTGKTAAFVLPILNKLMAGDRGYTRALIIAPTRELAEQIHKSINELGKGCRIRSITIYGGTHMGRQIQGLRQGAEIVVACPGRLLDHVDRRTINLEDLEVLVLDEADQMFDMGFLPSIKEILQLLPENRQTLLFSATMPAAIRELAHEILNDPVKVQIGHSAPAASVKQAIFPVSQHLKTPLLIKLLETTHKESVLIFTRTKHRAQQVAEQLNHAGYKTTSLQGNLSQNKRDRALSDFRHGKLQILVATDIASRGIDVSTISHVINYDLPDTVEAYTHRIGRTGRAAKTGDAFSLVARDEMSRLRSIERSLGKKLDQRKVDDFDYNAGSSGARHESSYSERSRSERPRRDSHRPESRSRSFSEERPRSSYRNNDRPRSRSASDSNAHHSRNDRPRRYNDDQQPRRSSASEHPQRRHSDDQPRRSSATGHAPRRHSDDQPRRSSASEHPQRRHSDDQPRRSSATGHPQKQAASATHVRFKNKKTFRPHNRQAMGEK